ncbi:hypothetical protein HGRIS_001298 [Hohenbuehelia grisea]|uniref:Transposase n=1 Tax=Hohenbuehelia grisea TaxID=104357 RepID=A0ABR3JQS4_9AGAR
MGLPPSSYAQPSGTNQYAKKEYPLDERLLAAFKQYATEKNGAGLNAEEQLARLDKEFGLVIGDELRSKLHDHFDHEFDKRMIGLKDRIERVPLNCLGPWHQLHCDGHERLNSQALAMGSVSLPIYAFKDQFSTFVPLLDLVPNVRNQQTICHLFLDLVEQYGCVPLQLIMDKGTEVADMIRAQSRLRLEAAPDFSEQEWPTTVQVQSNHNTPIVMARDIGHSYWMRKWSFQSKQSDSRTSIQLVVAATCPRAT